MRLNSVLAKCYDTHRCCTQRQNKMFSIGRCYRGDRNKSGQLICFELTRGPFHWQFYACNSNSIETSPCCNSVAGHQIATNFCTCHHSTAVVPCTTFFSNHCIRMEMRVKRNFHLIWIAMEKTLVAQTVQECINSLAPGGFDYSLKLVNFKPISTINVLSIFCEIVIMWMPQHLTDYH